MWQHKIFKTKAAMRRWIKVNQYRYAWQEIYINNGYGVEYRPLRKVY